MNRREIKRILILSIPYVVLGLIATNIGEACSPKYGQYCPHGKYRCGSHKGSSGGYSYRCYQQYRYSHGFCDCNGISADNSPIPILFHDYRRCSHYGYSNLLASG